MNLRQLSKWYKSSCGNFCKCSYNITSFPFAYLCFFGKLLWVMYKHLWQPSWMNGVPFKRLSMNTINFTSTCNTPQAFSWDVFEDIKLKHKMFLEDYNFNQTRKYGQFLSAINPSFNKFSDVFFVLNQLYYECVMDHKILKGTWTEKYWEIFDTVFLCGLMLGQIFKVFIMSNLEKYEMSRKHFSYLVFATFILDLVDIFFIIYEYSTAYDEMLLKFEADVQSYFVY